MLIALLIGIKLKRLEVAQPLGLGNEAIIVKSRPYLNGQVLNTDETLKILGLPKSRYLGRSDHVIIRLLESGLSISEVISLNFNDVKLGQDIVKVIIGGFEKNVPLSQSVIGMVETVLQDHPSKKGPLFVMINGKRITRKRVSTLLKPYARFIFLPNINDKK